MILPIKFIPRPAEQSSRNYRRYSLITRFFRLEATYSANSGIHFHFNVIKKKADNKVHYLLPGGTKPTLLLEVLKMALCF